jgi:hypothetical protein
VDCAYLCEQVVEMQSTPHSKSVADFVGNSPSSAHLLVVLFEKHRLLGSDFLAVLSDEGLQMAYTVQR